jgi:hypothetical protein
MKKLLTTTAIAGSALLMAANVQAQTTVKGQVHLVYKAISNESPVGKGMGSNRGFGKETQLDVQTKGKLNNGLDYGAGFSIEHDGDELSKTDTTVNTSGMFNENVYIDIIAGKTTFTVGADHVQNPDFTITNLAGFRADPEDLLNGSGNSNASTQAGLYPGNGTTRYSSFGAGIIQDFGLAKGSYYYVPGGTVQGDTGGTTFAGSNDATESGHEFMLRGDLGVKGLDATLFYSHQDSEGTAADAVGRMLAAKYNFGQITLAGEIKRNTAATAITTEGTSLAAGYAVNKDVTVAIGQARAERKQPGAIEEKNNFVQIGYSLGPVLAGVAFSDGSNIGGVASNDAKVLYLQLSTAF